ncbi:MAG: DedA family protein [Planctomycetaceae bacterium]|nr:DedA family protein [Planctomycetaceae bacterium]
MLIWTFLEGETCVIIAGALAHDGKPWLPLVILCAFCGSLASDQLVFFLGRYKGKAFVAKRPHWQARAQKVYAILERHQYWLILGFRFLYGLRNITPFSIGMSNVPTWRFVILNVIGAAVWANVFAFAGFVFGMAVQSLFEKHQKWVVMGVLVAVALIIWIVRLVRRRKVAKEAVTPPDSDDTPH